MVGLAIGCFGELSSEFGELCTFIARNMAVEHLQYYDNKSPEEALNMFRSRFSARGDIQLFWRSTCSARGFSTRGDMQLFSLGLTTSWTGHRRPPLLPPLATLTSTTTTSFMRCTLTTDKASALARGGPTVTAIVLFLSESMSAKSCEILLLSESAKKRRILFRPEAE